MIYFKKGDLVTCAMWGQGVVTHVDGNQNFPITVRFEDKEALYTSNGKYWENARRSLHQGYIDLPEPILKEQHSFETSDWVWVKLTENCCWALAKFVKEKDGGYFVNLDPFKATTHASLTSMKVAICVPYEPRPF